MSSASSSQSRGPVPKNFTFTVTNIRKRRKTITLAPVPGQPGQKAITFSPRFANRIYTVKATTTLSAPTWTEITTSAPADNGNERTLFDLNANAPTKFYRVEITKP